ncbi:hypothetical protein [Weissella confusa]|uniref:hypothetical protein n=1 Tax=Weissella confusa TaxID=1583 RepID=UPI00223C051D|nr:hypothetical protein [Weissella confusa]MCT0013878.1 hypothetical protein [Weissella confusa]
MNEVTPVIVSPQQLMALFVTQGVESLYDEDLAEQLGTNVTTIGMLREALYTGVMIPPWLSVNIQRLLREKEPLIYTVITILGGEKDGL